MKPGAVRLNVADRERARAFYEQTIGLREIGDDGALQLGADGAASVELVETPDAPTGRPEPPGSSIWRSSSPAGSSWRVRCAGSSHRGSR